MEESDNDYVVRELDVYVAENDLNLFLLQFPLRPIYHDPPSNITAVQYKPIHRKLELSIPFPREILDSKSKYNPNSEENVQKISSSAVKQNTNLCVGVIRDNALHITAVDEILQMRPSIQIFKDFEDLESSEDETEDKVAEPMMQVQMKRKESDRAQSSRKQSFGHIQNLEENEAWINLQKYEIDSLESDEKLEDLYYRVNDTKIV